LYFLLAIVLIGLASAIFYYVVERTTVRWRDRLVGRRGHGSLARYGQAVNRTL